MATYENSQSRYEHEHEAVMPTKTPQHSLGFVLAFLMHERS